MTMRLHAHVLATVGMYESAEGPVKRRIRVGAIFRDSETGKLSIRLDAVPTWPGWSGWFGVELVSGARPGDSAAPGATAASDPEWVAGYDSTGAGRD